MLKQNFKIDDNIYSKDIIDNVIKDFSEVAEISYNNWVLAIASDDNSNIEEIFNEFMNYFIWLYNELI